MTSKDSDSSQSNGVQVNPLQDNYKGYDNLGIIKEDEGTQSHTVTSNSKFDTIELGDVNNKRTSVSWCADVETNKDGAYPRKKSNRSVSIGSAVIHINVEDDETQAVENALSAPLLYKVSDAPPIYLNILFGLQQTLLSLAGSLIIPLLVADAVCGANDNQLLTTLLSTTMLMNGITSFLQTVVGVRLPLFQGPSASYIVPLLSLNEIDQDRCRVEHVFPDKFVNGTATEDMETLKQELISLRVRELIGPLLLCGFLHFLTGFTGLVGLLMRFIGPVTIVPTLMLIGIYIVKPTIDYVEVNWGIAILVWGIGVILTMYLGNRPMPIPIYSRVKGFHVIRYPVHQVFAILISILIGWALCGILTAANVFTDDKNSTGYKARTDARESIVQDAAWFYFPYPGQFGWPLFSISAFVGFFIATVTSILDSIGDYYACANSCHVPPPPGHATNRGIAVEGFCSMFSAILGAGHATTTYGGNIGAIGMTKVASRHVFVAMAIIYLIFAVLGKLTAVFISIPYPVLGGSVLTIIGVFIGVNLSNLQVIDLASSRNLSIMGMGIFIGLVVPAWIEKNPDAIQTGNSELDNIITILLGNPNFSGSILACFLDNTIPGTPEERGIAAWREDMETVNDCNVEYMEGTEVYNPLLPNIIKTSKLMKYMPIFPYNEDKKDSKYQLDRRPSCLQDLSATSWENRRSSVRRQSMGASLHL